MFGLETYVPLFIQGVRGGDATSAGRSLMPLFLAWAVSVAVAARAIVHFGFRRGGMIGAGLVAAGNLILVGGAIFPAWSRPLVHRRIGGLRPGNGADVAQLRPGRAACRELGPARGHHRGGDLLAHDRRRGRRGHPGATVGWGLAHRLARAGATGIDIVAALRPETHEHFSQASLPWSSRTWGCTLRDVYLLLTSHGRLAASCVALWLPDRDQTLTRSQLHERAVADDEGLAVAASEF